MIDKRAIRAGVDEQHRPAPAQADDALHEAPIERGAFHSAFRQDDIGIDEQRREQLGIGHGRASTRAASSQSPSPSTWKRSTPAPRNAPARASEKSPAPAASTHRRSRWPNTRRASSTAVSASAAVEADASAADKALGQTGGRRSEPGQGIAQHGRLPRLRQGARPTGGQSVRQARRAESPAASRLRQLSRCGEPGRIPREATRFPGIPERTRPRPHKAANR